MSPRRPGLLRGGLPRFRPTAWPPAPRREPLSCQSASFFCVQLAAPHSSSRSSQLTPFAPRAGFLPTRFSPFRARAQPVFRIHGIHADPGGDFARPSPSADHHIFAGQAHLSRFPCYTLLVGVQRLEGDLLPADQLSGGSSPLPPACALLAVIAFCILFGAISDPAYRTRLPSSR